MSLKVLIIGAAGNIGSKISLLFPESFELHLADRHAGEIEGRPVKALDITDYDAVLAAMQGMDAVVNLAIASSREIVTDIPLFDSDQGEEYLRFNQVTIDVNVRGAYNIFEAARAAGVKRVVYASSLTVYLGQPAYPEFNDDLPPRPANFYAVTKLFGEQLGEFFSRRHGLQTICLRFGTPHPQPEVDKYEQWLKAPVGRRTFVTYADLARAVQCALTTNGPSFGAYTIVSATDNNAFDLSKGVEIGWQPGDYCHADGSVTPVA